MNNWIELLLKFKKLKQPVALITITKCLGSTPCKVGSRMIITQNKELYGTIGGGKLEFLATDQAIIALKENKIIESGYTLGPDFEQCCGGKVEFIIEPMNKNPELFIFGAGHIGCKIANILVDTPFIVNLIDTRKNWFSNLTFDESITCYQVDTNDFKTFKDVVNWGENSYVLVMTQDHSIDFEIIAMALLHETKFLGLIGSKTKRVRFHNMLVNEMNISQGMNNVVCPVGLQTGGNTPKEIAIDIAAQLLKTHYS